MKLTKEECKLFEEWAKKQPIKEEGVKDEAKQD